MYQPASDPYSGGAIDISGLVPGAVGSGTPTVAFGNNAELNRYKAQQLQMQSSQHGGQVGIMKAIDPHQTAVSGASGAQVLQSHQEIMEVQDDLKKIQLVSGAQVQAQYQQHIETQRSQLGMGMSTRSDQLLMTSTIGSLGVPHQTAYLATNMTAYSMMNQQRSDQLAALNQARTQQLAMLTEQHTSTGMTTSNGYRPGSSDPTASFLGSTYGSPSLNTYSAIQMTTAMPTTTIPGYTSPYSSLTPSSSFSSNYSGIGSPMSTTTIPSSMSPSSSMSSVQTLPTGLSMVSTSMVTPNAAGPTIEELSATSTVASFEAGAGSATIAAHQSSVLINSTIPVPTLVSAAAPVPRPAPTTAPNQYFEGYAE